MPLHLLICCCANMSPTCEASAAVHSMAVVPWLFIHLRNEFDFWKVHGIMNTLGLLQKGLHVNFARDPTYS